MSLPGQNRWESGAAPQALSNAEAIAETTKEVSAGGTGPAASGPPGPRAKPAVVPANDKRPRQGLSIGVKATVLATIFGVLPVLVVGNLAYRSANTSITERIAQEELAEADQLSDQLRQFLQERVANTGTVASIAQGLNLFEPDLSPTARAQATTTLIQELTEFVQDYRTYASIAILDPQGEVVIQSQGSARELNQAQAAYFQQVLQTRGSVISEPLAIESGGGDRLVIYIATPILSDTGQVQGIVAAKIPADFIGNAVLRTASQGEGKTYRLVDSGGQIFQSLPLDPEAPEAGLAMADRLARFAQVAGQGERQAWIESGPQDTLLNSYAPLQGFERLDWSIVTSTETALAFLPQRQLLQTILLGTLATGVTAVLLGIWLAKRATRPVEQVAKAVELLGQGHLDARVAVRGNDELAVLGANVNRMGSQIQALLATLRQNAEQLGLQNDVLAELAQHEALIQGDTDTAAQAFTTAIAHTLKLERVSVWLHQPESQMLMCVSLYDRGAGGSGTADPLATEAVPEYFGAIAHNQPLVVPDVTHDWISRELAAQGSLGVNTRALLEIPIQIAGTVVGSIRCEHGGAPRPWKSEEQTFVGSIANLVSLALESEVLQAEVGHLLDVVSEVEDGNLTTQARVSDRSTGLVADTFNRLIERLAAVLQQVVTTAQQVSASANQQKSQANLIAANAEQQAAGVQQILQLTAQVEHLAQDAARRVEHTRTSLEAVQTTVAQGQGAIARLGDGIGILQEGSDRIVQQMKTLGEFVGLADQFVQDQTQIAYLTQTLALNASLVAARAVEQQDPRQFVVAAREFSSIANQVSQLAQQTNTSLTTLEQRSTQIQTVVSTVDGDVQRLGGLVEGFTQGVDQTREVFAAVQAVTVETVQAEATVARASADIVAAVQTATTLVRTITDIAAQTAELTQDNRGQSEQMERLSRQLLQTTQFFRLPALGPVDAAALETASADPAMTIAPLSPRGASPD